jgi:spermidine/putrescine transport system permease protein
MMLLVESRPESATAELLPCVGSDENELRPPLRVRLSRRTPQFLSVSWILLVLGVLYGPLVLLAAFSLNDSTSISLPWAGFTLRWYQAAYESGNLRSALLNSVVTAMIVAPTSVLLGTLAAFSITRLRFKLRGAAAILVMAPLAVPWLVIGIGALIFFNRIDVSLGLQTVMSIQIVVTFPLVAVLVSSRLMRFERAQEESAIDLGASQLQVLRYVLLPHIAPALAASAILSFTWSFNNFTITYFVGGFQLLFPVWVFSTLRHAQNLPIVNAVSTFVSIVQVFLIYAAWRLVKLRSASDRDAAESLVGGMRR